MEVPFALSDNYKDVSNESVNAVAHIPNAMGSAINLYGLVWEKR